MIMGKRDLYCCDMCGKEFNIESTRNPASLLGTDEKDCDRDNGIPDIDLTLCQDCYLLMMFVYTHPKEVSKFTDVVCQIEDGSLDSIEIKTVKDKAQAFISVLP